jgi:hypothetical protein
MDVYILDSVFNKIDIIDDYLSFIWTDRYDAFGDFELEVRATKVNMARFKIDSYVARPNHDRVMIIETRDLTKEDKDGKILKISGRSLESLFLRRSHRGFYTQDIDVTDKRASVLIRNIIDINLITGGYAGRLEGPDPLVGSRFPDFRMGDMIPPSIDANTDLFLKGYVYDIIQSIAVRAGLGFKITVPQLVLPTVVTPGMLFDVYVGADRTTDSPQNPLVAFRPDLENLAGTRYLESKTTLKNVVQLYSRYNFFNSETQEYEVRTSITAEIDTSGLPWSVHSNRPTGLDKRSLIVEDNDIPIFEDTAAWWQIAGTRAVQALAENRAVQTFDGEIQQTGGGLLYNRDYFLGDIVEVRNEQDVSSKSRVTEHITSVGPGGFQAFPSFTSLF